MRWSDGVSAATRTDANVKADLSVTAEFAIDTNKISASATAGGTIDPTGDVAVDYGADQAFTITPATGHHVADVLVDGSSDAAAIASGSYTFANVTGVHTIAASFAIDTFTLTYAAGDHGTVTGASPQTVDYDGSGSEVTAVPDTGYHFVKWSDDVSTAKRTDAHVTGNVTVTASFAIDTFTLTYAAGTGGTVTGASPQTVDYDGSGSEVTAVPAEHYHFVRWSDGVTDGDAAPTPTSKPTSASPRSSPSTPT